MTTKCERPNHLLQQSYKLAHALIGYFFMKKNGWFIEMGHADVIVGEISCQQKFFLSTFFE